MFLKALKRLLPQELPYKKLNGKLELLEQVRQDLGLLEEPKKSPMWSYAMKHLFMCMSIGVLTLGIIFCGIMFFMGYGDHLPIRNVLISCLVVSGILLSASGLLDLQDIVFRGSTSGPIYRIVKFFRNKKEKLILGQTNKILGQRSSESKNISAENLYNTLRNNSAIIGRIATMMGVSCMSGVEHSLGADWTNQSVELNVLSKELIIMKDRIESSGYYEDEKFQLAKNETLLFMDEYISTVKDMYESHKLLTGNIKILTGEGSVPAKPKKKCM